MIFVDTGAWYALMDGADPNHRAAAAFWRELMRGAHGRLVTSDYVVAETYNLLCHRSGANAVERLAGLLEQSCSVELLWVSPEDCARGLRLLLSRRDQPWSFTDCTSFVLMEALEVRDAFTFDQHFSQAGFLRHPDK